MNNLNSVYQATLENCIRLQENTASWSRLARIYRNHKQYGRATYEQEYAAKDYAEMWMRLERLIGVA